MGNLLIADPRLSDAAVITTSATVAASMPLGYLQKLQPTDRTRFTDLTQTISFDVDLTAAMVSTGITQWNLIWLGFSNVDKVTATWRIVSAASQLGLDTPVWDSGALTFWPSPGLKPDWTRIHGRHFLAAARTENWVRITVTNADNADGWLEFGRLYIADAYQAQYNPDWGSELPDWQEEEKVIRAEGGPTYTRATGSEGGVQFALELDGPTAQTNFYTKLQRMKRLRGSSKDILVIDDPDDGTYAMDGMIYGRLTSVQRPRHMGFQFYQVAFAVQEFR